MSVEGVVYQALCASAALGAYVQLPGSPSAWRIYPEAAPQTAAFPLVVYRRIATEPVASLGGASGLVRAYIQADCYHASLPAAIAMADAVEAALFGNFDTFRGVGQGRRSDFLEDMRLFAVSQDFAVWV